MKIQVRRASKILLPTMLTLLLFVGHAEERVQISLAYYPSTVIGVSASIPMFTTQDVMHSARAGITYAFAGLPAMNATYVLSGPDDGILRTYVGAGVGIAFPGAPAVSPSFNGHALAGANAVISTGFSAFAEVAVAGNSFGTRMSFGAGISYAFGSSN